jgi:hypothetical protein
MKLRAVKNLTYATRRLLPGDVFEARPRDVRVLLATRKVESVREPANVPAPPPAVAAKIKDAVAPVAPPPADDRAALRAEYEAVLGKAPFPGWSADVLREKIAAAKAAT